MSRWFRHYAGMMRDDKLVRVAIRSKQTIERVVWIWGAILESAAEIDDNGRYDIDPAEIAYFLRADQGDVDAAIAGLEDAGRIASGCVVKWGDRQFKSDRSAARVAAHRERKRAENRGDQDNEASQNGDVTLQKRHCIAPETETETETDVEEANASPTKARGRAKFNLPDWVPKEPWDAFVAMRVRIRKPMTDHAKTLAVRELAKLAEDGHPPGDVLNQSTFKSYLGLFPIKDQRNGHPGKIEINLDHRLSTPCEEPLSLLAARRNAEPLSREQSIRELTRCLTLCAPSGMSSDERAVWLATAWTEVSEIPAPAFLDACKQARRGIDHPAKLIPFIVRESEDYARYLRNNLSSEESRYATRNAPKLAAPAASPVEYSDPFAAERDEVSALMKELIASLKGNPVSPDAGE